MLKGTQPGCKALALLLFLTMLAGLVPAAGITVRAEELVYGAYTYEILDEKERTAEITGYTGTAAALEIPGEIDGHKVTSIGSRAFSGCISLTKIVIPDSVTWIGQGAFSDCTSLAAIVLPDSVTHLGETAFINTAYYNDISNWNEKVLYIDRHLIGAQKDIDGAYTVKTGTKTIAAGAFDKCASLVKIILPDSLTHVGDHAFYCCERLADVALSNGITEIGMSVFYGCASLVKISLPDRIAVIGSHAFAQCTSLVDITLPEGLTDIGWNAFDGCVSLARIRLPDAVTGIGEYAFQGCISLVNISIPFSVQEIGLNALGYGDDGSKLQNFTIFGYSGTEAEAYAQENGFAFIELLPESSQLTDPYTGITIAASGTNVIPAGAGLQIGRVSQPVGRTAYHISLLTADGASVQPNGEVTVGLPVPQGADGSRCKVYRPESAGQETDMQAVYSGGKLVFTADRLGTYVIDLMTHIPGDLDGNGSITIQDVMEACKVLARQSAGMRPTADEMARGDLDKDGSISISDVMEICKILARQA